MIASTLPDLGEVLVKDHRTYDLALAILHEEVEHESWFAEFLGEGPSGHFARKFPGESPYVSKFLTAGG